MENGMNRKYYNAIIALLNAVPLVRQVDPEFAELLLDKSQEYKDKIINKQLESDIFEFKKEIEKGL
jgi:hypothetical protein